MFNLFRKSVDPLGTERVVTAPWKKAAELIEVALQGRIVGAGSWFPSRGTIDNRKKFHKEQFDWKKFEQKEVQISLEILVRDVDGNSAVSWRFHDTQEEFRSCVEETESIIDSVIEEIR
ncbi:MAG TPA: hypothetical protein V6C76_06935 [Drouetiella sp.]